MFTGKVKVDETQKEQHRQDLQNITPFLEGEDLEQAVEWLNIDTSNLQHLDIAKRAAIAGSIKAMAAVETFAKNLQQELDILSTQQQKMLFTGKYQKEAYAEIKKQASWDMFDGSWIPNWFLDRFPRIPSAFLKRLQQMGNKETGQKLLFKEWVNQEEPLPYTSRLDDVYKQIYEMALQVPKIEPQTLEHCERLLAHSGNVVGMTRLGKRISEDSTEEVEHAINYLWAAGYIFGKDEEARQLLGTILQKDTRFEHLLNKLENPTEQINYYNNSTQRSALLRFTLAKIYTDQQDEQKSKEMHEILQNHLFLDSIWVCDKEKKEILFIASLFGYTEVCDTIIKEIGDQGIEQPLKEGATEAEKWYFVFSCMKNQNNIDNAKRGMIKAILEGHRLSFEDKMGIAKS